MLTASLSTLRKPSIYRVFLWICLMIIPVVIADEELALDKKWHPGTSEALDHLFVMLLLDESLVLDLYGPKETATARRNISAHTSNFYNPASQSSWVSGAVMPQSGRFVPLPLSYQSRAMMFTALNAFPDFSSLKQMMEATASRVADTPKEQTNEDSSPFLSGETPKPLQYQGQAAVTLSAFRAQLASISGSGGLPIPSTSGLITKEYRELPLADSAYNYALALGLLVLVRNRRCNS